MIDWLGQEFTGRTRAQQIEVERRTVAETVARLGEPLCGCAACVAERRPPVRPAAVFGDGLIARATVGCPALCDCVQCFETETERDHLDELRGRR